jgi:hypothetical protein
VKSPEKPLLVVKRLKRKKTPASCKKPKKHLYLQKALGKALLVVKRLEKPLLVVKSLKTH